MEEEIIIIIKPKRASVMQAEVQPFDNAELAAAFLADRVPQNRGPDPE